MIYETYEAELVSALIQSQRTPDATEVIEKIEPDMFFNDHFRMLFESIKTLHSRGLEFDMIAISDKTDYGIESLAEFMKKTIGSSSQVKYFGKRVRQGFYLREARKSFSQIVSDIDGCSDERQIGEIADSVENAVKNLIVETDTKKPRKVDDIISDYMDIVDQRYNGGEAEQRIRTGIAELDDATGGFNKSDLIVIGGTPGMGKTEFMMKIVCGATNEKQGSLTFSMEMDEFQLVERGIAQYSNLPLSVIRSPKGMQDDQFARFSNGIGEMNSKELYVLDQAGMNVGEICAEATKHKQRHPDTSIICVDYLGMIPVGKADRHDIAVGDISRRLKQLAKELKTPVVLLTQLTSKDIEKRPPNSRRPMPSDIKDSSRVQDDADWIIFPYRDEQYNEGSALTGIAEIIIAKARHGKSGKIYQGWVDGHFVDIDQVSSENKFKMQVMPPPAKEQGRGYNNKN